MPPTWFRVPEWVWSVNDEASGKKARAWVYLLGAWHAGNDPGIREVMRATGYGGGMTTALVRDVARWARDAGARLPEQWIDSAGTVPKPKKAPATSPINDDESSAGTVDRFCGNDSRARVPYETRRDETRVEPDTENAPAPAVAPTPNPEPTREPDPRPEPDSRGDGGDRHADPSSQAPTHAGAANGAGDPVPPAGSAGPAVAAWEVLDAIRRRNVKGAGRLTMTAAMGKAMKERLREHTADDLALMVEWVTGCRCGGPKCRACSWLQPKGYTHPKTYLRPDNCSEYLDLARQSGTSMPTTTSAAPDWTESDAARLLVQRVMDTGGDIHHRDPRMVYLAKRTLRAIGGRGVWKGRALTTDWIVAWRKEWPASLADYTRQQAEGAAK